MSRTNVEKQKHSEVIHVGENIKRYRIIKGYSLEYMATEMKISQLKFSDLERSSIIGEEDLTKIAMILNLGVEWLKEIPFIKGSENYQQHGNQNTNFQQNGHIDYTINNPVEQVAAAYENMIEMLKANINLERKEKLDILERFVSYMENQKNQ